MRVCLFRHSRVAPEGAGEAYPARDAAPNPERKEFAAFGLARPYPAAMSLDVHRASLAEAREMADWAASEGWQPGVGDIDAFYEADPDGYFVGTLDGQLAAMASVVTYSPGYAFAGFYIVRPDLRQQGLGHEIGDVVYRAMEFDNLIVGGDGVPAQVETYEGLGFVLAHWTDRWGGDAVGITKALAADSDVLVQRLDMSGEMRERVHAFDTAHVPAPRPRFVDAWYAPHPDRHTLVVMDDGEIRGLASVRPAIPDGARIGPLFADDPQVAAALLRACAEISQPWLAERGGDLYIDIPAPNAAAQSLAERAGLTPGFRCARMYRGGMPDLPLGRIYGNTSFELG